MRRDVLATNPALMAATVLEAPHCIAAGCHEIRHKPLTGLLLSHMHKCASTPSYRQIPHVQKHFLFVLTCWQRRNMIRVAESRSSSVSGLLQLLHSTYLQHGSPSSESYNQSQSHRVDLYSTLLSDLIALWLSSDALTALSDP